MKYLLSLMVLIGLADAVFGADGPGQICIAKAKEALPKIAGLIVTKADTRAMSPEQMSNWKGQTKPIIVDLDVTSVGAAETYSYICSAAGVGHVFVQRIMSQ